MVINTNYTHLYTLRKEKFGITVFTTIKKSLYIKYSRLLGLICLQEKGMKGT